MAARGQRILDAVVDHFRSFRLTFRGKPPQLSMLGTVLYGHVDHPGGYAELTLNNTSGLYKITKLLINPSYLDPRTSSIPCFSSRGFGGLLSLLGSRRPCGPTRVTIPSASVQLRTRLLEQQQVGQHSSIAGR